MADQQDVCALLNESGEPTLEQALAKAKEEVHMLDHVTLNIAVTGDTGVGKSTFVNAIRGLKNTDEGAAPTGVTETTMEPKEYLHPTMPNVKIWDLPGVGTPTFKAKNYMKFVKYNNYDFFIIVSASRFKDNDRKLAREIKKKKKNFYFVRTKSDIDVTQEEKKGVTEEQTLQKIRNNCVEYLKSLGSPSVFLITSHNLERFDFQELVRNLERDLPVHKRDALVLSLPVHSKQCLEKKYNTFKKLLWAVAIISTGIGAVPVPCISTVCDVFMVKPFLTKCYYSFGLDAGSLENLSKRVNKPELAKLVSLSLQEVSDTSMLTTKKTAGPMAAGVFQSLGSLGPVACSIAAAGMAFSNTQSELLKKLKKLRKEAEKVIEMAGIE